MILTYMINSILWVFQLTAKVFNILLQAIKYMKAHLEWKITLVSTEAGN